jgi:hypothetical protein
VYLLGLGVVLGPELHKVVQVMRAENGPISRQVVEIVHDDGHEQVDNQEGAQAHKGHKVGNGHPAGAVLLLRAAVALCARRPRKRIARLDRLNRDHDLLPRLARGRPKEHHESARERAEVVVPRDLRLARILVENDLAEELHADHGVDEEHHDDEQDDIWQGLFATKF